MSLEKLFLIILINAFAKVEAKENYDYCIIGAGPAGLQMGYFLKQAGRDYIIFERSNISGSFFKQYPRHRTLISINKRFTGRTNYDFNMRHDWNSLISNDDSLLFTKYTYEFFPHADDYLRYLDDYQKRLNLNVQFNTDIYDITKVSAYQSKQEDVFSMKDQYQNTYQCLYVVVATGIYKPNALNIEGFNYTEQYATVSVKPEDFVGQSVLILGHGNSAFETAQAIYGVTSVVHLASRDRVRLSWATHYVGDVRAVNHHLLDTYQLKSLDGILESDMSNSKIVKIDGRLQILDGVNSGRSIGEYDHIISCIGFKFDPSLFSEELDFEFESEEQNKYPPIDPTYESTTVKNLFFAGTNSHSVDHRKSAGGFIHGYRYTVQATHRYMEWRNHGVKWPSSTLSLIELPYTVIKRINEASGLYQMFSVLGDVIIFSPKTMSFVYLEEFPIRMLYKLSGITGHESGPTLVLNFEYGKNFSGPGKDVIGSERVGGVLAAQAHNANFLHPVIYYYNKVPKKTFTTYTKEEPLPKPDKFHCWVEDFHTTWTDEARDILPLRRFLETLLNKNLMQSFDESCLTYGLTTTTLPHECQTRYMSGKYSIPDMSSFLEKPIISATNLFKNFNL